MKSISVTERIMIMASISTIILTLVSVLIAAWASALLTAYPIIIGILIALQLASLLIIRNSVLRPIQILGQTMRRALLEANGSIAKPIINHYDLQNISELSNIFESTMSSRNQLKHESDTAHTEIQTLQAKLDSYRAESAAELASISKAVCEGLDLMADGDLTAIDDNRLQIKHETIQNSLTRALKQIRKTFQEMTSIAQASNLNAGNLAKASEDFAQQAAIQAATLSQSLATFDKIATATRACAATTQAARDIVGIATVKADDSNVILDDTIRTMGGVEASSKKIGNIISVIDEIAFQTNLLALNAGVEAARAGDAGRGFAVVATEVRALAQRSADAAKEIKSLVSGSFEQVQSGVKLVGNVGDALRQMVAQITSLDQLIHDLTESIQVQSNGLDDISTSMNMLEKSAQNNVERVAQANACSRNLLNDTDELLRSTSHDKTISTPKMADAAPVSTFKIIKKDPANISKTIAHPRVVPHPPKPALRAQAKMLSLAHTDDNWDEF